MTTNDFLSVSLSPTDLHVSTRRRRRRVYLIPIQHNITRMYIYDGHTLVYIFYLMITPSHRCRCGRHTYTQLATFKTN